MRETLLAWPLVLNRRVDSPGLCTPPGIVSGIRGIHLGARIEPRAPTHERAIADRPSVLGE